VAEVPGSPCETVARDGDPFMIGSVFAFVVAGAIRSENAAPGTAKVYRAGEVFFEPPGSEHLVSENASGGEPAILLAVFVADDRAVLTVSDQ
jgi:quercetin dioxygenase-like cupin family protein